MGNTEDDGYSPMIEGVPFDSNNIEIEEEILDDGKSLMNSFDLPISIIVDEDNSRLVGFDKSDHIPLELSGIGFTSLISGKAKETILSAGIENIEFLPTILKTIDDEFDEYFIPNILQKINCLDREKTDAKYFEDGQLFIVKKLALDSNRIPDNSNIFLLGEDATALIVVSELFKIEVENSSLQGFIFLAPENYNSF